MPLTLQEQREFALELVDEALLEIRSEPDQDNQLIAWKTLSIVGLFLQEVEEDYLHDSFKLAGLDIDSYFEIASIYTSLFVAAEVIYLTERHDKSLFDPNSPLIIELEYSEEIIRKMDNARIEGKFFRDIMLPNVEHDIE